ncbi:MAG: hypothetical protein ACLRMJ_05885 [Alistipes finegoldii]
MTFLLAAAPDLVSTSRTRSVGWLMTHAGPIAGADRFSSFRDAPPATGADDDFQRVAALLRMAREESRRALQSLSATALRSRTA